MAHWDAGDVAQELAGDDEREKDMKLRGRKDSGDDGRDRVPIHSDARPDAMSEGDSDSERVPIRGDDLVEGGEDEDDSFTTVSSESVLHDRE